MTARVSGGSAGRRPATTHQRAVAGADSRDPIGHADLDLALRAAGDISKSWEQILYYRSDPFDWISKDGKRDYTDQASLFLK